MRKRIAILILAALVLSFFAGCRVPAAQVVATTRPVYDFTSVLCDGTGIAVGQLVTENVSCLHDYTLQVSQMRMIESAEVVVVSGAGLEDFLEDALVSAKQVIDSSEGCHIHDGHDHSHEHHGHSHEQDPHIWLSPENAKLMCENICRELSLVYPQYANIFAGNLANLSAQLDALQAYGEKQLSGLSCQELITFHDGFGYFAESFGLTILEAIEEESGSEASAKELKHLIALVSEHDLPAVFTEVNGSASAANVVSAETGAKVYCLSMAMSEGNYFDAMRGNIDTIKEAME